MIPLKNKQIKKGLLRKADLLFNGGADKIIHELCSNLYHRLHLFYCKSDELGLCPV